MRRREMGFLFAILIAILAGPLIEEAIKALLR